MKISWIILTWNRVALVQRAITHNMEKAGRKWDELIWVDNGSTDGTVELARSLQPDVLVCNKKNLGVAKGYNRSMVLATCDWIVITGCDMQMPEGWLATFEKYSKTIPDTACASMYSVPHDQVPERYLDGGKVAEECGLPYIKAMPIERRMFQRKLLGEIGYLREDFGLYGWEDVEWARRVMKYTAANDLKTYVIPGQIPLHLQNNSDFDSPGMDMEAYAQFKKNEINSGASAEVMAKCEREGWPYYNPFI